MENMGSIAVSLIVDGINSLLEKREVSVVHRRIAPELVIRESTRGLS
jgi:DNA-binding LacI/PurR family transcriptional regulator